MYEKIIQVKMISKDGKQRLTDVVIKKSFEINSVYFHESRTLNVVSQVLTVKEYKAHKDLIKKEVS